MNKDSGCDLTELQVSGGLTNNKLLMQIQADLLGIPVVKPSMSETTAFGAALAAGKTMGLWNLKEHQSIPVYTEKFTSAITNESRSQRLDRWKKAVARSKGWNDFN